MRISECSITICHLTTYEHPIIYVPIRRQGSQCFERLCFGNLDLFRISSFGFRICAAPTGPALYICRESSTNRPHFMQNKANFLATQMNVNEVLTKDYENNASPAVRKTKPNKPNFKMGKMAATSWTTKPYTNGQQTMIQNKPKQTQYKANSQKAKE